MYQHRVTLGDPSDPKAVLHIAFKAASEDRRISPTGMAGGELLDRGSMLFLGEELPRQALVAEGKDMAVVYVCGQVHFGGPVFWCGLHYAGSPLTDPGLSPQTERLADAVIASIQVLPWGGGPSRQSPCVDRSRSCSAAPCAWPHASPGHQGAARG
jgi:hypothetical protein